MPVRGKTLFYKPDGTGRDTYILRDSGGLIQATRTEAKHDPGSYNRRSFSAPRSAAPRMDGKTVYYRTDGTGRDTYIASNVGGFSKFMGTPNFVKNLRNHERIRFACNFGDTDHYTKYQWKVNTRPGEIRAENMKRRIAEETVQRLSTPKQYGTKSPISTHPIYTHKRCQSAIGRGRGDSSSLVFPCNESVTLQKRPTSAIKSRA